MRKWVPIIDEAECTGCSACVDACDPQSLVIQEKLAVLTSPETCESCGEECIPTCTVECMQMAWVEVQGDTSIGRWEGAAAAAA